LNGNLEFYRRIARINPLWLRELNDRNTLAWLLLRGKSEKSSGRLQKSGQECAGRLGPAPKFGYLS
jgi:hypothetical protein